MTPEQIQEITAAATNGELDKLDGLLEAVEARAADQVTGADDSAANLKSALERVKAERNDAKAERDQWTDLGDVAAVRARLEEGDRLKTDAEERKAKADSEGAGADHAAIERLVEVRSNTKLEALRGPLERKLKEANTAIEGMSADKKLLTERLLDSLIDRQLIQAAPGADPTLYGYFRQEAKPFFKPRANGDVDWWRAENPILAVVDPETGTMLPGEGDKPMTASQLVEGKRADVWASFFPRSQARGGGLAESKPAGGGLRDGASGTEMLESVLG